jgi:hypothetical protein
LWGYNGMICTCTEDREAYKPVQDRGLYSTVQDKGVYIAV